MPLNKKDTQGKGVKNASTVSEDTASNQEPTLHRGLHNRHIQLIALGGAIGTGLFLGIGPAIQMAGPAVLLGYGVAGIIAFLIMRQLGELVVNLSRLYDHCVYRLYEASGELSAEKIDEVMLILSNLREGWEGLSGKLG